MKRGSQTDRHTHKEVLYLEVRFLQDLTEFCSTFIMTDQTVHIRQDLAH